MRAFLIFILLSSSAVAQSAAQLYGDPADAPDWRSKFAQCKCVKNIDGKCMTFGSGPYPYRQRDEAIESPHCIRGCYPDFSDVYGLTTQTKRELAHCYIDWERIRALKEKP